ncbi:unnamed protein product [Fraxinus pennsylvanica]|uniref:Uncharacterized protein n=1 Tax=Fraxinus pennsylvanica TaxID=56036 RepID=A0AAD2ADX3_9LAMI|nr:unnamed protein product [Fraxinus pennsylvanica]
MLSVIAIVGKKKYYGVMNVQGVVIGMCMLLESWSHLVVQVELTTTTLTRQVVVGGVVYAIGVMEMLLVLYEVSALKAGLRKVKILTEYVSTRRAKKACLEEEGSEGRGSAKSDGKGREKKLGSITV